MGLDAMILVFWMLSFKPTFSLSSFTFIKRLFSSCLLSAVRVVSSAYLRLLVFLPAVLIPASASSSPVFLTMYSAYKLNKWWQYSALTYSFLSLEPVCYSMSSSNLLVDLHQISQEAGQVVWYSHLLKNFPQFIMIHTGFGIVSKAVGVFLELSFFFYDPIDIDNLISDSSNFLNSPWTSLEVEGGLENFGEFWALLC